MNGIKYVATISALVSLTSCKKQVHRISIDKVKDLSGRFNDTDSQMIAQSIVDQMLNECYDLNNGNREQKILAVGDVRNLSHEHIDSSTFMNDIERNLINSGKCRIVANRSIRDAIQEELADLGEDISVVDRLEQQRNCAKKLGVNRMIFGSITSIVDKEKKESVKFYQFDIKLIDIYSNEVLWMGSKKIKKYIKD
ncbi:MAG: penicillin-binding protein activator LpoB [Cytophagales bacterium]|jgi:uncharacterized protein (TIGR02722 family)|nr:penicillin-binding protein activator LpoB [Cytophagales bacterium]